MELKAGARLSKAIPRDEGLQHERRIGYLAIPDLPVVFKCFAHHDCVHNQLVSFHNRVGGKVPEPTNEGLAMMRAVMKDIATSLPDIIPWDIERVVSSYKGAKRAAAEKALQEYRASGLTEVHSWVSMFIKCEKIRFTDNKVNPDPRAIQHRSPVFALVLARFIKAIEEFLYSIRGTKRNGLPRSRIFGKGLNSKQRGELLADKLECFDKPAVLSVDVSRLDRSAGIKTIGLLHEAFNTMLPDQEFANLLKKTKVNKVTTSRRLKYTIIGNIMSGDSHTSAQGNLYMSSATLAALRKLGVKHDILCDGDDCLIIIERVDVDRAMLELPGLYLSMGMVVEFEDKIAETMEEVRWCQSSPVLVDGRYRFIREPRKVLSGALVGPRWMQMHSEQSRRALANTIGLGEAILHRGIPVLQEYAMAIIRNAATSRQIKLSHNDSLLYKVRHEIGKSTLGKIPTFTPLPVSDDTRLSFSLAFGISIDEQLSYEEYFRSWEFGFGSLQPQPEPVDVTNWEWVGDTTELC